MTPRLQWDIGSCGPPSPTGGPTSAQHKEWSVTWTGTKTWDVQVSFIHTLAQMSFLTFTALTWEYLTYYVCFLVHITYKFSSFCPEGFFVSGLNLTADKYFVAENPKQSLRTLTFSNWECLRRWLEEQRPGSDPKSLNIIAGDFVGPLPLSSLVIALNQKLLRKNAFKKLWFYSTRTDPRILHTSFPLFYISVNLYALLFCFHLKEKSAFTNLFCISFIQLYFHQKTLFWIYSSNVYVYKNVIILSQNNIFKYFNILFNTFTVLFKKDVCGTVCSPHEPLISLELQQDGSLSSPLCYLPVNSFL